MKNMKKCDNELSKLSDYHKEYNESFILKELEILTEKLNILYNDTIDKQIRSDIMVVKSKISGKIDMIKYFELQNSKKK